MSETLTSLESCADALDATMRKLDALCKELGAVTKKDQLLVQRFVEDYLHARSCEACLKEIASGDRKPFEDRLLVLRYAFAVASQARGDSAPVGATKH